MLRPAGGAVPPDTRRRTADEAAGPNIIRGVAGRFGGGDGLGRQTGRERGREEGDGGGRHLRAGQGEGGGGYLGLSARCFTAEDCAPGLFTVSKAKKEGNHPFGL